MSTQLDATNSSITSVAIALERSISQLSAQLGATNSNITSVATTLERNVSQLSNRFDATKGNRIVGYSIATVEKNICMSQLSTWLDATNSNIV